MTLKEEACSLINQLPDKVMEDIVRQLKRTMDSPSTWKTPEQEREESMQAFRELQEMRRTAPLYIPEDYKAEYEAAIAEKYGI